MDTIVTTIAIFTHCIIISFFIKAIINQYKENNRADDFSNTMFSKLPSQCHEPYNPPLSPPPPYSSQSSAPSFPPTLAYRSYRDPYINAIMKEAELVHERQRGIVGIRREEDPWWDPCLMQNSRPPPGGWPPRMPDTTPKVSAPPSMGTNIHVSHVTVLAPPTSYCMLSHTQILEGVQNLSSGNSCLQSALFSIKISKRNPSQLLYLCNELSFKLLQPAVSDLRILAPYFNGEIETLRNSLQWPLVELDNLYMYLAGFNFQMPAEIETLMANIEEIFFLLGGTKVQSPTIAALISESPFAQIQPQVTTQPVENEGIKSSSGQAFLMTFGGHTFSQDTSHRPRISREGEPSEERPAKRLAPLSDEDRRK